MRESNFRVVSANKAAITLTSSLYDRRALDCSADQPLVTSLNHLTYLVSSSTKVREALCCDGGIERLVDILRECNAKECSEKIFRGWKWTLALQCLVVVGTRGTESTRKRLVEAGIAPILTTILDNFLITCKAQQAAASMKSCETSTDSCVIPECPSAASAASSVSAMNSDAPISNPNVTSAQSAGSSDTPAYGSLNEVCESAFHSVSRTIYRLLDSTSPHEEANTSVISHDNMVEPSITSPDAAGDLEMLDLDSAADSCSDLQGMSTDNRSVGEGLIPGMNREHRYFNYWLQNLAANDDPYSLVEMVSSSNSQTQAPSLFEAGPVGLENDEASDGSSFTVFLDRANSDPEKKKTVQACPRLFRRGVLIPKEEDALWALQLLAFISKYGYLRSYLEKSYIIPGMSLRSQCSEHELSSYGVDVFSAPHNIPDVCPAEVDLSVRSSSEEARASEEFVTKMTKLRCPGRRSHGDINYERARVHAANKKLPIDHERVADMFYSIQRMYPDTYEEILNHFRKVNCMKIVGIINALNEIEREKQEEEEDHYNYETYDFDTDRSFNHCDISEDASQKRVNVFPIVEKFTVKNKFAEFQYWAGVTMRNSCRKDESRGGVRQCAWFDCGKWEDHPKQFAKCRRCKRTKYCSKECQLKAWNYHRHWCYPSGSASGSASASASTSSTNTTTTSSNSNIGTSQQSVGSHIYSQRYSSGLGATLSDSSR